ncbi:MAG: hypothetical protein KAI47_18840, partial [Deltaproteobacteria bacterium]|nr:hypothetical protein [Deltaproteobacteria bacterium]
RWGRHAYVTRHLPPASQQRYVTQRERLGDLRVTKCRVASVRVVSGERATVLLSLHWFRLSRGHVHATTVAQDWHRKGREWRVVRQRVIRGAPLPIFPNPAASSSASLSPGRS